MGKLFPALRDKLSRLPRHPAKRDRGVFTPLRRGRLSELPGRLASPETIGIP
jgi:hypothetical protein